jgi:hypothetical protein
VDLQVGTTIKKTTCISPEDGDSMFLSNADIYLEVCMALLPIRVILIY